MKGKFVYTYVLLSKKDNMFYVGSTIDLQKRFKDHLAGRVESTKNRRSLELIYYESCLNEQDARKREGSLKSFRGKITLKRRLKSFFIG